MEVVDQTQLSKDVLVNSAPKGLSDSRQKVVQPKVPF
jgi:hypothetical protein